MSCLRAADVLGHLFTWIFSVIPTMVANDIVITRWPHPFFVFCFSGLFHYQKHCNSHSGNLRKGCCEWPCARFWLQAPSRQAMHYWLQQLQQKRWEYSNTRGQRDSWSSPTLPYPLSGLVGQDNGRQVHTHTDASWYHFLYLYSNMNTLILHSVYIRLQLFWVLLWIQIPLSDMQNPKGLIILYEEKKRDECVCLRDPGDL